jgi:DNA-binding HxlR family transcriptional regulator
VEQRTYNQYCATARTLDLVGERWTLLLIRELLTGPKRFSDLQASLRGLGTGLLATRLKHLEREGLAHKITLPPPARTPAYALTEAGEDLGAPILELARWGLKWAMGERGATETFHAGWAVLGLRACFDSHAAGHRGIAWASPAPRCDHHDQRGSIPRGDQPQPDLHRSDRYRCRLCLRRR